MSNRTTMKSIITGLLLTYVFACLGQSPNYKEKNKGEYGLYVSAGIHLGFWNPAMEWAHKQKAYYKEDQNEILNRIPWNIHIDKQLGKRWVIGLGYSYDKYAANPLTKETSDIPATRQNIRVRFYKFLKDPEKRVCSYIGATVGTSFWTINAGGKTYVDPISREWWPTAQFLIGFKTKISETLFWQTEFAVGPPYACQTSLGIKL
jgi:hypothetical protein